MYSSTCESRWCSGNFVQKLWSPKINTAYLAMAPPWSDWVSASLRSCRSRIQRTRAGIAPVLDECQAGREDGGEIVSFAGAKPMSTELVEALDADRGSFLLVGWDGGGAM